jgi:5'-nucleotidase
MRTSRRLTCFLLFWLAGSGIAACAKPPVIVTILHFNDVYEIDALQGGKVGGLARVATVVDDLKRSAPYALTTLGGDYLAPSAIGTARVDGQPLAGRQMVDVLNAVGVNWATFGNHEFDVSEAAFRASLKQEKFGLVSSNVTDADGKPFDGTTPNVVVPVRTSGRTIQIGLIGLTVDANKKPWVRYLPSIDAAKAQVAKLAGHVDAIVALTHLSLAEDQALVTAVPEIDLVLGGHEHENWMIRRGSHLTPIVKADANVRTVAIVTMTFDQPTARLEVSARLEDIDDRITPKPAVDALVKKWTTTAFDAFKRDGFTPEAVVATVPEPLDGREAMVRHAPTLLTDIIAASLVREAKQPDLAIFNGGSIRIDDVLPPGPVREYDIIRVLPFGGKVLKATFGGALLAQVLDIGVTNAGSGGYLQTWGVTRDGARWLIQGRPLDPARRYAVAINDFLLTGGESNLGFLTRTNPQVRDVQEYRDIRQAVIDELKARFPKGR